MPKPLKILSDITKKVEKPKDLAPINPVEKINIPEIVEVEKTFETEKREVGPVGEGTVKVKQQEYVAPASPIQSAPLSTKSPTLERIEDILEEDLADIYFKLPPEKQEEFRAVGEETASKIELLLSETKIKIKKILELIFNWLKIIPGLNKFFLEQEAKIKTDKLLEIKEKSEIVPGDKNKI